MNFQHNLLIGLEDISLWAELHIEVFYLNIKDGSGKDGNVTVTLSASQCSRSEVWVFSIELYSYLKNSNFSGMI